MQNVKRNGLTVVFGCFHIWLTVIDASSYAKQESLIPNEKILLVGQIQCEQRGAFGSLTLKASYIHFHSKYGSVDSELAGGTGPIEIEVDRNGKFEFSRLRQPMLLYCETTNGEYVGSAQVDCNDVEAVIKLQNTTDVSGRLVDLDTSQPLIGQTIFAGIDYLSKSNPVIESGLFSGSPVTTGEDGQFAITGLVREQRYDLFRINVDENNAVSLHSLGTFWSGAGATKDLGIVDSSRAVFSESIQPAIQVDQAIENAGISYKDVLLVFSSPGNESFRQFWKLQKTDDEVGKLLRNKFELVVLDCEYPKGEIIGLAKRLGIQMPTTANSSHFCFLSSTGEPAASFKIDHVDALDTIKSKFLKSASKIQVETQVAAKLLEEALHRARLEGKRVLVQETGPDCKPCLLMSKFLDSTRELWIDDFVWLKLDQRWEGTLEITEKLRNGEDTTIPWYAVLDAEGVVEFTSFDSAGRNRGYPLNEKSRSHFRKLLENHTNRMTKRAIDEMLSELDK